MLVFIIIHTIFKTFTLIPTCMLRATVCSTGTIVLPILTMSRNRHGVMEEIVSGAVCRFDAIMHVVVVAWEETTKQNGEAIYLKAAARKKLVNIPIPI